MRVEQAKLKAMEKAGVKHLRDPLKREVAQEHARRTAQRGVQASKREAKEAFMGGKKEAGLENLRKYLGTSGRPKVGERLAASAAEQAKLEKAKAGLLARAMGGTVGAAVGALKGSPWIGWRAGTVGADALMSSLKKATPGGALSMYVPKFAAVNTAGNVAQLLTMLESDPAAFEELQQLMQQHMKEEYEAEQRAIGYGE